MTRQNEKHIPYFKVLETLRSAEGCALCELELQGVRRYIETVMYEQVNDGGVRRNLAQSGGYCPRHARMLMEKPSPLGTAILYRDQVSLLIDGLNHAGRRAPWKRTMRRKDFSGCPACRVQAGDRERYAEILAHGLEEAPMREALAVSAGLCAPHFWIVLDKIDSDEARSFLIDRQRAVLAGLLHQLDEFIRKQDYRFQDESYGPERTAWIRAVQTVSGAEGVF